jgi:hypothetical protein
MCWGFSCGDGWFNIINTLSASLCNDWLNAKDAYDLIKDKVGEVKSQWSKEIVTTEMIEAAKLKMDTEYDLVPTAVQVKEKFGGLRFYTNGATDIQDAYITFAEMISVRTCEVCGKPGKRTSDGWIRTLCKEHMVGNTD